MIPSRRRSRQQGASLFSMLILAVIVAFLMLMGARVFPSVNEYVTVRKAISRIMANNPSSPADVRAAFDKTIEVEYSIKTISGKDLVIQQVGDGGLRTSYAYNVEIPIYDPTVYILVKYSGSASTPGVKGP